MPGTIPDPLWVYRIIHIENLREILNSGMFARNYPETPPEYVKIGNTSLISKRSNYEVKIDGYGFIGDYVPFYFGTNLRCSRHYDSYIPHLKAYA